MRHTPLATEPVPVLVRSFAALCDLGKRENRRANRKFLGQDSNQ